MRPEIKKQGKEYVLLGLHSALWNQARRAGWKRDDARRLFYTNQDSVVSKNRHILRYADDETIERLGFYRKHPLGKVRPKEPKA